MGYWLNSTRDGVLAPSIMYASDEHAWRALQHRLDVARRRGHAVAMTEVDGLAIWMVRNIAGVTLATYWLSDADQGPAMRADH